MKVTVTADINPIALGGWSTLALKVDKSKGGDNKK
jgi:hypothetical protein